ncbi:NAD(P)-dependent oxidoreductase [Jeotgalibacillus proteolyticus]|uniref:Oxidoreductase n=1 Tax=Jeotgalibacillus proteolyticus TaxID=2082395 RepID=A0A2S5GGR4_9BACL|nr:NAD(P)-dependent oxidoreductase [Jeotgalibacillus proteolyticus]PPA72230.1 oxidoreductase [Jeotgalibacillus proteolyticus]
MAEYKIGFIGTGVMGRGILSHLLEASFEVYVYTRTKSKAESLLEHGAKWLDSPLEIAQTCNLIFTMVGYPEDVEEVYLGENGLISNAEKGTILVDLTTSTPSLAEKIAASAKEHDVTALDAPVSGGDIGARNGTLSIMAGGSKEEFDKVEEVFGYFGENIVYHGPAGSGQHAKMSNQIVIASTMIGVCESLAYAKKAGLDLDLVLKSISKGAAGSWSLSNLAPRMLKGDYEPGFYVRHFIKDLKIALEESEKMNLRLPGLNLAKELYDDIAGEGHDGSGTQALITFYT